MAECTGNPSSAETAIREGQTLTGPLFPEPMRVEPIRPEEVLSELNVFLLTKAKAEALNALAGSEPAAPQPDSRTGSEPKPAPEPEPLPGSGPEPAPSPSAVPSPSTRPTTLRLAGTVPPEVWNRLGTRILPKLRSRDDLSVGIELSVSIGPDLAGNMEAELQQILDDLGLGSRVRVERVQAPATAARERGSDRPVD